MQFGIFFVVLAAIAGWVKRDSRFACVVVFTVLWLLIGLNTHNADFDGYQYFYDFKVESYSGVTPGYLAIEKLGWFLDLTFIQFRMLTSLFSLGLITLFVRRYSRSPNAVLVFYLLMPFFYDIVQFKFFLASSVAIYGLRFLIDRTKLCFLIFLVFLGAAVLIHPASALFGVFLIGLLDKKKSLALALSFTFIMLFLSFSGLGQILGRALTDPTKGEAYFAIASRFGWITYFVSAVCGIALSHLSYSLAPIVSEGSETDAPARFETFFDSAQYAFLPLAALIPLSVQNFYRPIRSANLLLLMHFTTLIFGDSRNMRRQEKAGLILIFILWLLFTQVIVYKGVLDVVLADELANNLLWI